MLLVLDEVQKIKGWSEEIKRLWDAEQVQSGCIRPLILGSASLLLQHGLSESMAGRFYLHYFPHWTLDECEEAFGWDLDTWLAFGGYPGAAPYINRPDDWKQYVNLSLIEAVLARDVLQLQSIRKPALLRNLFGLASTLPAQIISYTKMLGQLQDAGNTTTLADYLELLASAFLVTGLELFSKGQARQRASSPKLICWNNALITAQSLRTPTELVSDLSFRGRLLENAVGAHLLNSLRPPLGGWSISYWRQGSKEVDFVVTHQEKVWAIEVKSGKPRTNDGMLAFRKRYPEASPLYIDSAGLTPATFFKAPAADILLGTFRTEAHGRWRGAKI